MREMKNAGARFTTSRSSDYICNVVIWMGEGRSRTERKKDQPFNTPGKIPFSPSIPHSRTIKYINDNEKSSHR